ncbi:MAG: hypothetical protein KKA42_10935 [candidate division Zixibacteria bacterium]|nr:hypothetical protein [candidate division Zixibacteria bacterium]
MKPDNSPKDEGYSGGSHEHAIFSLRSTLLFAVIAVAVALAAIHTLQRNWPVGPVILLLGGLPIFGLLVQRRSLRSAAPDLIFGAIDTGLLVIPALWGGLTFGVAGAIAGGVVGDALTDGIAGFFEGAIARWLRKRGIDESRDPLTTSLGKMTGCLVGAGAVLVIASLFGVTLRQSL